MSTRAGIKVTDGNSTLHFYKHSDGYPEGTLPLLNRFLDLVKSEKIRDNTGQAAGWLILLGAEEYQAEEYTVTPTQLETGNMPREIPAYLTWKCGSIEPTTNVEDHGDLEYIYTIDINNKTIEHKEA